MVTVYGGPTVKALITEFPSVKNNYIFIDAIPVSHAEYSNRICANTISSLVNDHDVVTFFSKRLELALFLESCPYIFIMGSIGEAYF